MDICNNLNRSQTFLPSSAVDVSWEVVVLAGAVEHCDRKTSDRNACSLSPFKAIGLGTFHGATF